MSEKYVWTCYRCRVQSTAYGVGNVPNGWTAQSLCPLCAAKEADKREASSANTTSLDFPSLDFSKLKQALKPNLKSDLKPGQLLALCALVSGFIGFVFLWLNESSAAYYNLSFGIPYFPRIIGIIFLILSIPFIKLALKKNLGCSIAAIAILFFAVAASIYIRFFA